MNESVWDLKDRTRDFARRVVRMYGALPETTVAQVMGKQVLRSGTSVGANYREASRARSHAEFLAKIGDALRELEETDYWLDLLGDEIAEKRLKPLRNETNELIAIFVTILKTGKSR